MSRNWLTHPAIATGIAVNVFVLGLAVAWSGPDPAKLWRLLGEDGIVEWMQFLSFAVIAALVGFAAVTRLRRLGRVNLEVLGLLGVSALVALAALEEISWFQRVLGVTTPDFFVQNNRQAETNLHNLALGSGSLHKTVLLKLILIVGLTHNLVLPLLARSRPAIKQFVESLGLYLPPLSASIPYLVLVILSHVLIDHPRKGELGEMFGAVHYLATVFVAYFVGLGYGKPAVIEHQAERSLISSLFAMLMVFLLFVSWLLSAGYVSIPPQ
jgi:flagellar biosynthesis protein FliR